MTDKVFIFILFKYANFADVFSKDLIVKLSKYIEIDDYAIDLIKRY